MSTPDETLWTTIDAERGEFFNVVNTCESSQITVMTVRPGKVAGGPNTHRDSDQVALVLDGQATVRVWEDGTDAEPTERVLGEGGLVHIPAGTQHWVKSTGEDELVFFSVYAPPEY
jgi:mannose-6-phosphate isomerase-like protein (cupin superfamily)